MLEVEVTSQFIDLREEWPLLVEVVVVDTSCGARGSKGEGEPQKEERDGRQHGRSGHISDNTIYQV